MYRWHGDLNERLVAPVEMSEDFFDVEDSFEKDFLIYDHELLKNHSPFIESFQNSFGVQGGEPLKSLSHFSENVEHILDHWPQIDRNSIVYVFGGGSLGDFAGFFASILKRGIHLIQIPSTWLSALDSAHGGKNGLNTKGAKNQLGTFYPAQEIWLIKKVLDGAPEALRQQALGEFVKMSLLMEPSFYESFSSSYDGSLDWYWSFLGPLINKKLEIVAEDPFELGDVRQSLNLGHTMGHILEHYYELPHGEAVFQGLFFSLQMSAEKSHISLERKENFEASFEKFFARVEMTKEKSFSPMPSESFRQRLLMDKKNDSQMAKVLCLSESSGVIAESIKFEEIIEKAIHWGWVKK